MVFAVNPTADKTMDTFVAAAKAQNGTGAGMAMGSPTSAAAAAPGASATPPPVMMTSIVATPVASPSAGAAAPPLASPSVATGTLNGSGVCQCFCGVGSFPVAGQGMAAMGGYPGAVPTGGGK